MSSAAENKADSTLRELEALATESTKRTLLRHGAREPIFGVKVEDLKKILKREKQNHELALALYKTRVSDAMYLAGLMANGAKMSREQIQEWADEATWSMISEWPVAWITAESPFGFELATEWIDTDRLNLQTAGWAALSMLAGFKEDSELDIKAYEKLIDRVEREIHQSSDAVRYRMNAFLIATGAGIASLKSRVLQASEKIGKVRVDMGDTSCKVPVIKDYIAKIEEKGLIGRKRKMLKC